MQRLGRVERAGPAELFNGSPRQVRVFALRKHAQQSDQVGAARQTRDGIKHRPGYIGGLLGKLVQVFDHHERIAFHFVDQLAQ